uniref:Uncharacterized protein n=1 Tax=Escherichia phage PMBT16 TaxID=3137282 RepID=A0AAU8BTD0_9VIRU
MILVYKCIHNIQIKDTRNPPPPFGYHSPFPLTGT